jgi:hypothetical protein
MEFSYRAATHFVSHDAAAPTDLELRSSRLLT